MAVTETAADLLARRAVSTVLGTNEGASSFFSKPGQTLDPSLFVGEELRPDVRRWVLDTLYKFWGSRYAHSQVWSQVWLAGSGITFQWQSPRSVGEPGDLDILIGVDFPMFFAANPDWHGIGEVAMAELFNDEFRAVLDKDTDSERINSSTYAVTWYVNPGATDINDIHPYAAFNVSTNTWTVHPPDLAPDYDPVRVLPSAWWESFDRDRIRAEEIKNQFNSLANMIRGTQLRDPHFVNYATALHGVIDDGARLFDEIHTQRREAFTANGNGYADYHNVRYQTGKRDGYLHNLHTLNKLWESAHANKAGQCNGKVPLDASHALTIALQVGSRSYE
jgi:hypothetical protein